MSLLFARRAASPEIDESDWVFVHEETCGLSYKDAVLQSASHPTALPVEGPSSREALAHVEDALAQDVADENWRGPSGRGKKKFNKRR